MLMQYKIYVMWIGDRVNRQLPGHHRLTKEKQTLLELSVTLTCLFDKSLKKTSKKQPTKSVGG